MKRLVFFVIFFLTILFSCEYYIFKGEGNGHHNCADKTLLAYYPLDNNAKDLSGHGYHGTSIGGKFVADRFGNPGSACELKGNTGLNGSNIYIDLPNIVDGLDNLSMSIWVKHNSYSYDYYEEAYISYGTLPEIGYAATSIFYSETHHSIYFCVMTDAGRFSCSVPFVDSWIGQYKHYVLVYDGHRGLLKGYIDNELVASNENVSGAVYALGPYAGIGTHWWANGEGHSTRLNAVFDEARIYNYPLSVKQIMELFKY